MFKEVATGIKIKVGDLFFIANVKICFFFLLFTTIILITFWYLSF